MMNYTLPRADKEKTATLSQRSLGPGNFTPSFKNNTLVEYLDFVQYRKTDAEKSPDIVRLQNYSNYQSVCLAQNLDDIAQDVMQTKTHVNGLHSETNAIENNQDIFRNQLGQILEKLEIIQTIVQELKDSFEKEKRPTSPIIFAEIEDKTSFKWFGSSSDQSKQLTLK